MRARCSGQQRRCECTGDRCQREHDDAGLRDAPIADDFAERGERQRSIQNRELVGVDHPIEAAALAPKSRAIEGSATLTMVLSSTVTTMARMIARIAQ